MRRWLLILLVVWAVAGCSVFDKSVAKQVVDAFQEAGLQAEQARKMSREEIGGATEGMQFLIPDACPHCDGRVLVYASRVEVQEAVATINEMKRTAGAKGTRTDWAFTKGQVVVLIHPDVPEKTMRQYMAILNIME